MIPQIIEEAQIDLICQSFIEHYKNVLDEEWKYEDFIKRLKSLSYLAYKYARDEKSGIIFVIGLFGAQIATGAGGRYLTNAELYVLPEYRGKGIASELVNQAFTLALEDGIEKFDSLTYRVPGYNSVNFWTKKLGAKTTNLYHIEGNIEEMLANSA